MTLMARVIEVLERGPSSSTVIAAELGISVSRVSARLTDLRNMGVIKIVEAPTQTCNGKQPNVYAIGRPA